jgi:hypothetical protein
VLELSVAKFWCAAVTEWEQVDSVLEAGGQCICGYQPITDRRVFKNRLNHQMMTTESYCSTHFVSFSEPCEISKQIYANLAATKRYREINGSFENLIHFCCRNGILSWNDFHFCTNKSLQKSMNEGQRGYLQGINNIIKFAFSLDPVKCNACGNSVFPKQGLVVELFFQC